MNIHVGNLPLDLTESELRSLFETCGIVDSVELITNRRTHEPLGYGFVVMQSEDAGKVAISTLNGKPLKGKDITVSAANRPEGKKRSFQRKPFGR
jgi:RNA recognition motif-containing protein